jgi:hypothetical protein
VPYSDPYGASPETAEWEPNRQSFEGILSDVKSEIEQGVAFALAPFPKPKLVTEDVYA